MIKEPHYFSILVFYTFILMGVALVSVHYRKMYEELKEAVIDYEEVMR